MQGRPGDKVVLGARQGRVGAALAVGARVRLRRQVAGLALGGHGGRAALGLRLRPPLCLRRRRRRRLRSPAGLVWLPAPRRYLVRPQPPTPPPTPPPRSPRRIPAPGAAHAARRPGSRPRSRASGCTAPSQQRPRQMSAPRRPRIHPRSPALPPARRRRRSRALIGPAGPREPGGRAGGPWRCCLLAHTRSPRTNDRFSALKRIDLVPHTYFPSSSNTDTLQVQAQHPPESTRSARAVSLLLTHNRLLHPKTQNPSPSHKLGTGGRKEKACGRSNQCPSLRHHCGHCLRAVHSSTKGSKSDRSSHAAKWPAAHEVDTRLTLSMASKGNVFLKRTE